MTRLFGLIGRPLTHSFSSAYFTEKFKRENITDAKYQNFELQTIKDLSNIINTYPDLCGLNVTIPYKEEVIPYLDALSPLAERTAAVNTIRIERSNSKTLLTGYNTDIRGFRESIVSFIGDERPNALVLGSGGASKSVCYVLEELNISYQIVSRNSSLNAITYNELDTNTLQKYHLLINTSPLGMYPHVDTKPDIPYQGLSPEHYLFDLVYNPDLTAFMNEGKKAGAKTQNGYNMLVEQAEAAWHIWNTNK